MSLASTKPTWKDVEAQFYNAAEYLESLFARTIKLCDLFEQLSKEVVKTCESDDQFFSRTNACLESINSLTEVSDPETIPPEVLYRATSIFLQAQYMLAVISRVMDSMVEFQQQPVAPPFTFGGNQFH
jgi:hypothetical protein